MIARAASVVRRTRARYAGERAAYFFYNICNARYARCTSSRESADVIGVNEAKPHLNRARTQTEQIRYRNV